MSNGLAAVYFVVSLIATLYAAAVFAEWLDKLGARLGLPEALLGLLTAAGADAPELASAVAAVTTGAKDTGFGVLIGASVLNIGTMLGLSVVLCGCVRLRREQLVLEGSVAAGVALLVALMMFGVLPAWAVLVIAVVLLTPYVAVVALAEGHVLSVRRRISLRRTMGERHRRASVRGRETWQPLLFIVPAIAAIVLGSIGMVHAAIHLGHAAGMPDVIVGTLVLAVVTSLPNAYTGIRLGLAGRGSALVSETMNSNTINLVGGIMIPSLFVTFASGALERADVIWLLVATVLATGLLFPRGGIRRVGGGVLLLSWVAFAVVQAVFS
ncbi:MAG: sodium:calcium antiporter [Gaiellaceae bacterium]